MPLAVLLNHDDPLFDFEHAVAHRNYYSVMFPLNRFSVLPYNLDPATQTNVRAGNWNLNHQQAHNDYSNALPSHWSAGSIGFGIPNNQILVDSDRSDPESRTWWTFANHQEHYIANSAVFPLPWGYVAYPDAPAWWWTEVTPMWPFW